MQFQIASGEDTNSIFESAVGTKYDDQEVFTSDEDAYGEEDHDAEEDGDEAEAMPIDHTLQPQKLPLETIMEENSVLHK